MLMWLMNFSESLIRRVKYVFLLVIVRIVRPIGFIAEKLVRGWFLLM